MGLNIRSCDEDNIASDIGDGGSSLVGDLSRREGHLFDVGSGEGQSSDGCYGTAGLDFEGHGGRTCLNDGCGDKHRSVNDLFGKGLSTTGIDRHEGLHSRQRGHDVFCEGWHESHAPLRPILLGRGGWAGR